MIRKFTDAEVLETFIKTVHEESPISLVDQTTNVGLSPGLHLVIKETIQKMIKKASPDLSVLVRVDSIQDHSYYGTSKFETFFNLDPADVQFYVSREADPVFFRFNNGQTLTTTNISIDYYYPSPWTMTPPRDEKAVIRRTMDEILFAWTIVSKTLMSMPIIRFDDEDEAAEAVFAFANTLLFTRVVTDSYYYKNDFIRRLMYIEKAIKGDQPAFNKELATILYPENKKIGQLEVPVATIQHNRLTQYGEGYLSCRGQERYEEYYIVLRAFSFYEFNEEVDFTEEDISDYLRNDVGRIPEDFRTYDMIKMERVVNNDNYRRTHPPMITTNFKGIIFNDICPFTYGSRAFTYIHFEKDFVSHLEKTFKHLDAESAVDIARRMDLPKDDEVNDGYDVDPSLIDLDLFSFDSRVGSVNMIEDKTKEKYKNHGLHDAEQRAAKEAAAVEVEYEPGDVNLLVDSLKSAERIREERLAQAISMTPDVQNIQGIIRNSVGEEILF